MITLGRTAYQTTLIFNEYYGLRAVTLRSTEATNIFAGQYYTFDNN